MKSFDTELKKYAEKIRLKAMERRELRERILSYMEYHPLPKQKNAVVEKIESQPFVVWHFNNLYTRIAVGVFALLIVVGVPIAAERAVPGDVLYLVKTGINENIKLQLASSPYEKVTVETELLERRIGEARLLASEGKLTPQVGASIADDIKQHANAAQNGLDELRTNDADGAAIAEIAFGSALDVQSAVLNKQSIESGTSSIQDVTDAVEAARVEALLKKASTTPSYDGLMARVESETTRANELFAAIDSSATDEEKTDIKRRLADIDRKITGAQAAVASDTPYAISELSKTLGLTHKLIVFMTDIDIRSSVDLETLVPVELTKEERSDAVNGVLSNITNLRDATMSRLPLIDNENVLEKVKLGLNELNIHINLATSSLASGNIDLAEKTVVEAFALASDLDQLTVGFVPNDSEGEQPVDNPESSSTTTSPVSTEEGSDATSTNVTTVNTTTTDATTTPISN